MRRKPILAAAAAAGLVLAILATPAGGQVSKDPAISARQFKSGSAKVTVAGSFQIDQDVAINSAASIGDGDFTWLQFGVSGSAEPNALITFGDGEGGITLAEGSA